MRRAMDLDDVQLSKAQAAGLGVAFMVPGGMTIAMGGVGCALLVKSARRHAWFSMAAGEASPGGDRWETVQSECLEKAHAVFRRKTQPITVRFVVGPRSDGLPLVKIALYALRDPICAGAISVFGSARGDSVAYLEPGGACALRPRSSDDCFRMRVYQPAELLNVLLLDGIKACRGDKFALVVGEDGRVRCVAASLPADSNRHRLEPRSDAIVQEPFGGPASHVDSEVSGDWPEGSLPLPSALAFEGRCPDWGLIIFQNTCLRHSMFAPKEVGTPPPDTFTLASAPAFHVEPMRVSAVTLPADAADSTDAPDFVDAALPAHAADVVVPLCALASHQAFCPPPIHWGDRIEVCQTAAGVCSCDSSSHCATHSGDARLVSDTEFDLMKATGNIQQMFSRRTTAVYWESQLNSNRGVFGQATYGQKWTWKLVDDRIRSAWGLDAGDVTTFPYVFFGDRGYFWRTSTKFCPRRSVGISAFSPTARKIQSRGSQQARFRGRTSSRQS